ncbi:MAG: tetrahydrofolate dehydrogenase/cyclohydrolase catalytic domain-containing protein, partial [Verrucomicrobiota bacterium]
MKLIEGKKIAEAVYAECVTAFAELKAAGHQPGLAVVLIGDDPASKAYVGSKDRKCRELGMHSVKIERPAEISQDELHGLIDELNADEKVHGILVQMPLP